MANLFDQFDNPGPAAAPAGPTDARVSASGFGTDPSGLTRPGEPHMGGSLPADAAPAANPFDQFDQPGPPMPPAATGDQQSGTLERLTAAASRGKTFGLSDKAGALGSASAGELKWLTNRAAEAMGYPAPFTGTQNLTGGEGVTDPNATFADNYHKALAAERQRTEDFAQAHPIASRLAYGTGALSSISPTMTSPTTVAPLVSAPTLGGRVVQGMKAGATAGGLSGFGATNDESALGDLAATGQGAGLGAVIGGAVPVIADKVAQPLIDWVSRRFGGQEAIDNQAIKAIASRVAQDQKAGGPTAQDMLDIINTAGGKPLNLADVGGENVKGLTERLAQSPGQGKQIITEALTKRDLGAGSRIAGDVNAGISNGGSAFDTAAALDASRKAAAAPLYDEAFASNPNVASKEVDRILLTPAGQKALAGARVKMQNDMSLMATPDADLMEQAREAGQIIPGGKGIASGLKLRTLDYVKRSFDDQIGTAQNAGERDNARILIGLKNRFVNALDKADVTAAAGPNSLRPEGGLYAQARAAYSGPSQSLDAVVEGQKVLTKAPEQIQAELADLEAGDKEFYKLGAADAIKAKIAKTGMGGNEAKQIIGSDWAQKQIRPLFDSQDAYEKFITAATHENRMFQTTTQMLRNSATARRAAEMAHGGEGGTFGSLLQTIGGAATGEPMVAATGLANMGKNVFQNLGKPNPEVDAAAARFLMNQSAPQNVDALARIARALQRPNAPMLLPGQTSAQAAQLAPALMQRLTPPAPNAP
jgi:hypothetical protein